jgi:hypothetical protein
MKILIALRHARISGVVTWSHTTAVELVKLGHEVHIWFQGLETDNTGVLDWFQGFTCHVTNVEGRFDLALCNYNDLASRCRELSDRVHFVKHGTMFDLYESNKVRSIVDSVVCLSGRSYELETNTDKVYVENFVEPVATSLTRSKKHALLCDIRTSYLYQDKLKAILSNHGYDMHSQPEDAGVVNISRWFQRYDLVIGYGRVVREALVAGCRVLIYGINGGDGFVSNDNFDDLHYRNFSGWSTKVLQSPDRDPKLSSVERYLNNFEGTSVSNRHTSGLIVNQDHLETLITGEQKGSYHVDIRKRAGASR